MIDGRTNMGSALFARKALGLVRVAVVTPQLRVADVTYNVERLDDALRLAAAQGAQLAIFPELGITAVLVR